MKVKFLLLAMAYCIVTSAVTFEPFEWESNPTFIKLSDAYQKENVVFIKYDIRYDFRHEEDGNLYAFETEHKVIRILNEESINNFNTYYLNDEDVHEWVSIKARTIAPDGTVKEFDDSNIKEIVDEESGKKYKIFAVDGIEEGNTVEFLTIKKKSASSFGRDYLQFSFPVLEISFELTCPEKLRYLLKLYNGHLTENKPFIKDSIMHYSYCGTNIPGLLNEPFSSRKSNLARIEYRLDRNLFKGYYQLNTWDNSAQSIYSQFYDLSDKENKALDKFLKRFHFQEGSQLEKIKKIEEVVKKEFLVQDQNLSQYNDLTFVLEQMVSSEKGLTKLYTNIFDRLGIPNNVVLTCGRDVVKFDKDYPSWNYLNDYVIYFPEEEQYMSPSSIVYRVGMIPAMLTAQYGLFVRKVNVGEFQSAVADIKYIKESGAFENYDHIYSNIQLDPDETTTTMDLERCFKGLSGGYFDNVIESLDETRKQKTLENISAMNDLNPLFSEMKIESNSHFVTSEHADFVFTCKIETKNLIEVAGNKLLLKLGLTIGPQAEMYQEEDRQTPVENSFNRSYYRELIVNVPNGYHISNPEAANMIVKNVEDENAAYVFISKVEYVGAIYKVVIKEYYTDIFAPIQSFEAYRKVINAAADFNKVVLVLEKI